MKESFIQIGFNDSEGVVKVRAPDTKSPGGCVIQIMSPSEARMLADWLDDGAPSKLMRVSDGKRYTDHEVPLATAQKLAKDLRDCADALS